MRFKTALLATAMAARPFAAHAEAISGLYIGAGVGANWLNDTRLRAADIAGANVNLGQLYAQQRKYTEAIAVLRTAVAADQADGPAAGDLAGEPCPNPDELVQMDHPLGLSLGAHLGGKFADSEQFAEESGHSRILISRSEFA